MVIPSWNGIEPQKPDKPFFRISIFKFDVLRKLEIFQHRTPSLWVKFIPIVLKQLLLGYSRIPLRHLHILVTEHLTIIMITHNLEIAKTADRVIVIEDGKIIREG